MMSDHVLITPKTCDCNRRPDHDRYRHCNVCDGGLAICALCGKAEAELDGPCVPRPPTPVAEATRTERSL